MQPPERIDAYIKLVSRRIRYRKARIPVSAEIKNHIIDGRDYYMSQGLNESDATDEAIKDTGDAKAIGDQLDKIHRPEPKRAMRLSLTVKTMLRSPIGTLLTFLLIAAASFTLFFRATDWAITNREVDRAVSYYRGVWAHNAVGTTIESLVAGIGGEYIADTSAPVPVMLLCLAGTVIFLFLIKMLFFARLMETPPLRLLQGGGKARG